MAPHSSPAVRRAEVVSPAQRSWQHIAARASAAALCHAIRYRLAEPGSPIALAANLDAGLAQLRSSAAAPGEPIRLWTESLPVRADAPLASGRCSAELDNALYTHDRRGLRALLLRYQNGVADLILVAHRAVFDRRALALLGRAAVQGATGLGDLAAHPARMLAPVASATREELRAGSYAARPEWGLGGGIAGAGTIRLSGAPLGGPVDRELLVAAIGFVLARFSQQAAPVVATLADDGVALLALPCASAPTVGALVESIRARRSAPPAWYTSELASALRDSEDHGQVAVGLWWLASPAGSDPLELADGHAEYRACLAPPFPLTISLERDDTGACRLGYAFERDRFAPGMVAAFDRAVGTVQRVFSGDPATPLAAVPLLDADEAARVAALGRPVASARTPLARIERCVAELAAAQPDAPAVSYEGRRLGYGELDRRANQIAHTLRAQGVRDGDRVGVCLERSLDLVVCLLAVMRAGAAYVPMDPSYPAERLAYTAKDAGLSIVVTALADFPVQGSLRRIDPARLFALAADAPTTAPPQGVGPDDAAYVIYTSGSTGRPKGVVVPHRNVTALVAATRDDFGLGASDTWTLFHSSAFDFSVWEIWGCLTTGGHLVVVPYWVSRSPDELLQLLVRERVSVLNQTPSAFAQLQEVDRHGSAELALRLVIFGGEALDCRMLLRWFDRHPESQCRLVNMFGITETTVHVTAETITRHHALTASRSVGQPIAGWHCYVMDAERRLLPPGVPGEIYVGGAGVALQYLNRPELTTERFLHDPFTGAPMYRSGDKGRLRADGRLEHLGRLDGQVKLRGFRIELDELRAVLLEHAGVVAAAVVVNRTRPDDPASARLDAYVVLEHGTTADVKAHAVRVLPEYMQPATVTALPALPLTTNGKLDPSRLPRPKTSAAPAAAPVPSPAPVVASTVAAPGGNPIEDALRQIWTTIMGVEVRPDDNFFDLGGNSLYAVRIAAAMREQKLPSVPTRELYLHQTIRRIVAFIGGQQAASASGHPA